MSLRAKRSNLLAEVEIASPQKTGARNDMAGDERSEAIYAP